MSVFSAVHVAKQALLAQQRALQVTARNIANVNTPGYSRQRAVFEPLPSTVLADGFQVGGGVSLEQVERVVDRNLENQILREKQNSALRNGLQTGLDRIEGAFDELNGSGIGKALSEFFASVGDLANDPGEASVRQSVVLSLQGLVDRIHSADQSLAQLENDANAQLPIDVTEINDLAQRIAGVNDQIVQREFGANEAFSELRDQRAVLLQELGSKIDFTSFEREDGSLAVFVGGGFLLVDSGSAAQLQTSTQQPTPLSDPTFLNVYHVSPDGGVSGPITNRITGGSLGAALELRDDRVPFYRQQLDSFAFTLANQLNTVHLAGRGLVDDNGRNLLIDPTLGGANPPGDTPASVLGAAGAIAVNPDIEANPRHLAAGLVATGPASAGDNTNALLLAEVREQSTAFFAVGDPVGGPATGTTQTLASFFANLAGTLGAEVRSNRRAVEQSDLVQAELDDRRAAVSGVSIDEETTDLVRFQRAFEAAARVLSVSDQLLESLLNI